MEQKIGCPKCNFKGYVGNDMFDPQQECSCRDWEDYVDSETIDFYSLSVGDVLIAIDECRMDIIPIPSLTIGNEYSVINKTNTHIFVIDDDNDKHYYTSKNINKFFKLKTNTHNSQMTDDESNLTQEQQVIAATENLDPCKCGGNGVYVVVGDGNVASVEKCDIHEANLGE